MSYDIVYADFPWPYTSYGSAKLPYECMPEKEIAEFNWTPYLAKHSVVFSWATGPKLDIAFRCGEVWRKNYGLHYAGMPYIWVKTKLDGVPVLATGPRPRLVKPLDEFLLAFATTPKRRTFPLLTEKQVQHVFEPKPKAGEHSRKPAVFRDLIVELLGDRPRIELFARERVPGWDAWGDQVPAKEITTTEVKP